MIRSIAHIAVIMGIFLPDDLHQYFEHRIGFIDITDLVGKWAIEFYEKYDSKIDWEDFLENSAKYGFINSCCFDEAIGEFLNKKLKEYKYGR